MGTSSLYLRVGNRDTGMGKGEGVVIARLQYRYKSAGIKPLTSGGGDAGKRWAN